MKQKQLIKDFVSFKYVTFDVNFSVFEKKKTNTV